MGGAFHFGGFHMDFPIRKPARRAEPGKRAERSDGPLFAPLKQVSGLLAWADADPRNAPDYACGLVSATAEAVLSAMKNGRPGGWIFVQENFIRAVRAIRDMNDARGTAYTDRDLEERFPAAWSRMADAVETCARGVPRPCAGVRRIPRDVLGYPVETQAFGWSRPIRGDALQGLFDYCLETAKAALTSPTDRATVEDNYKSGVFNDREENRRTLSLHTNMLHKAAQDHARIEEKLDSVAAKLDAIGADAKRGADAAEANGAKLDATGGERAADEKAEARHRETLEAIAANGAKLDVLIGRSTDPVISTSQMASMCGVDLRIVEYWEQRLKDPEHKSGRQPPEGYTLATRCDSGRAKVFADTYKSNRAFHAASGKPKRISFDENRDKPDTSFADSLDSGAMDK
jgi:hypothetical protein